MSKVERSALSSFAAMVRGVWEVRPRNLRGKVLSTAASLLLASTASLARAEEDARALFEADVVELASKHHPQLRAALLSTERARWDASGLEAQYAPVIALDGSATQTSNPSLTRQFNLSGATSQGAGLGQLTAEPLVITNRMRRADVGAELRKHTLWGTDLALRLSGNVHETYYDRAFGPTPAGSFGPGYGTSLKLSLKQPLIRGRGRAVNEAALLAARLRRGNEEYARDRIASEVLRDALTAYWELWHADAAVRIEQSALEVAVRQRDEALARVETGSLAPAEALAFETQVATREENLLNAQLTRTQRELDLREKLGTVDERDGERGLRAESEPLASLPPRELLQRDALAESAEIKELLGALELAQLEQKTASDPQKPRLDLESYVQAQGLGYQDPTDAASQLVRMGAVSGFVSLTFEAPMNRRRERAEAAKARLASEVAKENLKLARQRVLTQVGSLHARARAGEQAVELAERTLDIARRQLAAEQARYQSGSSTALQVLEAENQVRSAELRVARLRADFMQNVLALSHYTGALVARYVAGR